MLKAVRSQVDSFDLHQRQAIEAATAAGARALEGSHALVWTLRPEP